MCICLEYVDLENSHAWSPAGSGYVRFSRVEKRACGASLHRCTHSGSCARCSVGPDFAKVFLWLLCGHGIRAELSPGRAAFIMRPLKARGAASTSLVKTPCELLLQGSAEELRQHWAEAELLPCLYYKNIVPPRRSAARRWESFNY